MGHHITGVVAKEFQFNKGYIAKLGLGIYQLNNGFQIMAFGIEEQEIIENNNIEIDEFIKMAISGSCVLIETHYFGGIGKQSATIYCDGVIISPRIESEGNVINLALKSIGVKKGNCLDEFEYVNLGKYRDFPSDA